MRTMQRESRRYWDDMRWAREHSTELHQRFGEGSSYGGSIWVAIYNNQVVGWGSDLMEAKKMGAERTGADPREIPVKFIESVAAIYGQTAF